MKGLIFVYALSYGGAAVALRFPFVGFLAYVCFAILRPEYLWDYAVPQGGNFSRILAIGMLIGWALHGFGNWRFGKAGLAVYSLLALLAWSVVSAAVIAPNKDLAWSFVEVFAKIVAPLLGRHHADRQPGPLEATGMGDRSVAGVSRLRIQHVVFRWLQPPSGRRLWWDG